MVLEDKRNVRIAVEQDIQMLSLVTQVTPVTMVTWGNATYEQKVTAVTPIHSYLAMLALLPIKRLVLIPPPHHLNRRLLYYINEFERYYQA